MLKLNIAGIPEELKKNKKWVGFEIGENGKKPIDPKSIGGCITYASISDPSTWGTFEEAVKLVEEGLCDGIGYAITKDDKLIFLDFDLRLNKLSLEEEKQKMNCTPFVRQYDILTNKRGALLCQTILDKGIMPSEKVLDFPVDCNTLTGSVNL